MKNIYLKQYRKIINLIFLIILMLFVSSCGSDQIVSSNLVKYQTDLYEISYPSGWDALAKEELEKNMPKGTIAAFRAIEPINGIFPNISIIQENVAQNLNSYKFAKYSIENIPFAIQNLNTVQKEEIKINDIETIVYIFLGRRQNQERDFEFFQTYFTKNGIGITITAVCSPDVEDEVKDVLTNSLKSFKFITKESDK